MIFLRTWKSHVHMEQLYSWKDDCYTQTCKVMDLKKTDESLKGKRLYERERLNQKGKTFFPAITKTISVERQDKTDRLHYRRLNQNKRNPLNHVMSTFRLPQIKVKKESSSVSQRWCSHSNLCKSTSKSSLLDTKPSSLHSSRKKKINFEETAKRPKFATDLTSTQNLLKSLRIINLEVSGNETRMSRFQKEDSLRICRMELTPRRARKPKESKVELIPRSELQVTYPTLKLSPTDQCIFFSPSPSPCWSMGSLDSFIYGSLTLTQPPPDITSSCSPSDIEPTPPLTPHDLS